MKNKRRSGILLAISSLPSKYGIGTFSKEAYEFVDFLTEAGQSLWQILPLGPTGYGDSPYQSFSTFAHSPYYIDLEEFINKGILTEKECSAYDYGSGDSVDYEVIYRAKYELLRKVFERLGSGNEDKDDYERFKSENSEWLNDYALYMAIKNSKKGVSWTEWPKELKLRKPAALKAEKKKLAGDIEFYSFIQYIAYSQWNRLKKYANDHGIDIIGDIPIYVAMDSADTWSHPELFELDEDCNPINVAGCPPDAFTALGQLWGNPLYRWDYHKQTGYEWWMKRLKHSFETYDIVRIDHFRGFDEYYAIPYGRKDAVIGQWQKGPGLDLFKTMNEKIGRMPVIAEDLGFLTDSVVKMVKKSGFPGMKVLQFAFDSREESDYLPHNYERNCVVYTGTHDNDTTQHWYDTLAKPDKSFARRYLDIRSSKDAVEKMIRSGLGSVADTCIIPMQDYLKLGGEARMNYPSTLGNNWKWRLDIDMMNSDCAERIYKLCKLYGRAVIKKTE